jgi:hypothetical protein
MYKTVVKQNTVYNKHHLPPTQEQECYLQLSLSMGFSLSPPMAITKISFGFVILLLVSLQHGFSQCILWYCLFLSSTKIVCHMWSHGTYFFLLMFSRILSPLPPSTGD